MTGAPVMAAGAVLWRPDSRGVPLVALVHRPKYDDWSLPKGKADPGEHLAVTACREVREETGVLPVLTRRLPSQVYPVDAGRDRTRPKVVSWWLAHVAPGSESSRGWPNPRKATRGEIDAVDWLPVEKATARLSHDRDRVVLEAVRLAPLRSTTLLLVRHASAGSRGSWPGSDRERPLDDAGRNQARWVSDVAGAFGAREVLAADLLRCTDTVAPYAERAKAPLMTDASLTEYAHDRNPRASIPTLRRVTRMSAATLVCSQGGVIPDVIALWHAEAGLPQPPRSCPKGSCWVLSFHEGELVAADFHATLDPQTGPLPPGSLMAARSSRAQPPAHLA